MKKIFAYTLTAILLGAVIMLFPLRLYYVSHGEEGPLTGRSPYIKSLGQSESWSTLCSPEAYDYPESFTPPLDIEKGTTQPIDPFVGMLALSFLIALVVYLLVRRRIPSPTHRYYRPL